jgi:hypothetical protein
LFCCLTLGWTSLLAAAGLLVVASCLLEWGCPPALLLQLLEGTQLPQQLAGGLQAVPSHHNISGLGTSLPPSQSSSGSSAVHTTQAAPGAKTGNNADSSNRSGSRAALLVLVWLVAHCGLFQRHLQQLQAALDRLPWLPPWPQVGWVPLEGPSVYPCAASVLSLAVYFSMTSCCRNMMVVALQFL